MDAPITLGTFIGVLGILVAIVGGITAMLTLYKYVTNSHDRVQKWDNYDEQIQRITDEQCMLTYCMMATLDGLHQLGCNGKVTEAREKLDKHINQQAHGQR